MTRSITFGIPRDLTPHEVLHDVEPGDYPRTSAEDSLEKRAEDAVRRLLADVQPGDVILVMSRDAARFGARMAIGSEHVKFRLVAPQEAAWLGLHSRGVLAARLRRDDPPAREPARQAEPVGVRRSQQ